MAETVSLDLLGVRINELLDGQRRIEGRLDRIETTMVEIDADLRSLARVMLRLESRVHALEQIP